MKKLLIALLLIPFAALAQQKKTVRIGGGPDPEMVRRWPKPEMRPNMNDIEVAAEMDRYLDRLSKEDLFSGTVLVARNGKIITRKSVGFANRDFMIPNTPETKFNLGSINKIFTQIAITRLIDEGKLSPNDTIAKVLPGTKIPSSDKITIAQLLSNSSGMGDIFTDRYDSLRGTLVGIREYFPLFESDPLQFAPGTSRRYSNAGYVVLGAIIEKLSGQNYYDYVRENIFKPAGMNDTDSYIVGQIVPNRAVGYTRRMSKSGELRANLLTLPARGSSAGGGYSTVDDLYRFANALVGGNLLSESSTRKFAEGGMGYAGGSPGINALVEVNVPNHFVVVVLGNYDPPSAELLGRNIRALLGDNDED